MNPKDTTTIRKTQRCNHKNGLFREHYTGIAEWCVENGIIESDGNNGKPNISHYSFECDDCGKTFVFRSFKFPKWIKKYYENSNNEP